MPSTSTFTGPSWAGALTTVSTLTCTSYMWGYDFSKPFKCRIPFFSYAVFMTAESRKYFLPGLCFTGWTVGCGFPSTSRDISLAATVTRKLCVPSGFKCCGTAGIFATIACNTMPVPESVHTWRPAFEIRWEETDMRWF